MLLNAKLIPVLVLGGDIYPALDGDFPGNFALSSTQALASKVTGVTRQFPVVPYDCPAGIIELTAETPVRA